MSFEEKIMNISKKLQVAKKVPKNEHFLKISSIIKET